jgi:hypothetical protein
VNSLWSFRRHPKSKENLADVDVVEYDAFLCRDHLDAR